MNLTGLFRPSYFQHGEAFFFSLEVVFSTQEFFPFTQELLYFTQEILPLLPKKLLTPYSRNLRVPTHVLGLPRIKIWSPLVESILQLYFIHY